MGKYGEKLNDYFISLNNERIKLNVLWLREVSSAYESLLTTPLQHRFYEIQYVLDGNITMKISQRDIIISKGQLILISPGTNHEILDFSEITRKLVFAFDVEFIDYELQKWLNALTDRIHFETPELNSLTNLLITIGSSGSRFAQMELCCLTEVFFYELLGLAKMFDENPPIVGLGKKGCSVQEKADRIIEYIRENTRRNREEGYITVTEISEHFFISRRHLVRILSEATGKTTRQLIDEEKVRYICELLTKTDHTLTEIAAMTGFASEYSLIRFFKTKEGYTPGKYRKYTTI